MVGGGVHISGRVPVVVEAHDQIQPFGEEVALAVFERRHQRVAPAELFAIDGVLPNAGLYVLVHVREGHAEHQPVGPRLVHDAELGHDRFVVVGIVETFYPDFFRVVDIGRNRAVFVESEDFGVHVHLVVVVGIVLESVDFVGEAVFEGLAEVEMRLVGVERAVRVGGIDKPAVAFLLGDDVDDPTDGIRAELDWHDAFVDFDPLGEVDGDVVQAERAADPFLGNPVDEDLDMLAAEPVQGELHVRSYAARFADFEAGGFGQRIAQVAGGILQVAGIDGHGVECRTSGPADPVG